MHTHTYAYLFITSPSQRVRSIAMSVSVCMSGSLFICPLAYLNKNSSGDEIANVNFLRPHRTILQNIIRCWIFNTTQAVAPGVGVASWY